MQMQMQKKNFDCFATHLSQSLMFSIRYIIYLCKCKIAVKMLMFSQSEKSNHSRSATAVLKIGQFLVKTRKLESFSASAIFLLLSQVGFIYNFWYSLSLLGFIYTFWYSLSSTSSSLEQGFQSIHHLQMTSSEGFQQHFCIISKYVCCGFYMKRMQLLHSSVLLY